MTDVLEADVLQATYQYTVVQFILTIFTMYIVQIWWPNASVCCNQATTDTDGEIMRLLPVCYTIINPI